MRLLGAVEPAERDADGSEQIEIESSHDRSFSGIGTYSVSFDLSKSYFSVILVQPTESALPLHFDIAKIVTFGSALRLLKRAAIILSHEGGADLPVSGRAQTAGLYA